MSFSSRLRTKKNITLPDIENTSVYNTQRCYNTHRRYSSGPIQSTVPLQQVRRPQQGISIPSSDAELDAQYSSMSSADISNANVECILPSK